MNMDNIIIIPHSDIKVKTDIVKEITNAAPIVSGPHSLFYLPVT